MPWLAARLVAGLFLVFGVIPVPWALYNPEKIPSANYPLHVFIDYWGWVASDLNHLWLAIAASVVVGLFATEIINVCNRPFIWLLECTNLKDKLKDKIKVKKISQRDINKINKIMNDAEFRVWLLGYQNGAPVKYLDWHGFNATLAIVTAGASLLLTQLWILWGLVDLVPVLVTGSLSGGSSILALEATAEWFLIFLFIGFFAWTSYDTSARWRSTLNRTWMSLHKMWKKTQRASSLKTNYPISE